MSSKFKIGDSVAVLDDVIEGVVAFAKAELITITTTDDIELEYHERELVKMGSFNVKSVQIKAADAPVQKKQVKRDRDLMPPPMQVDLHIEKLVKHAHRLEPYDILNIQLDTAQHKLDFAINRNIPRLVFIHGVGEGKLKAELEFMTKRYEGLDIHPADFKKYGQGAMLIYIRQNAKRAE